MRRMKKVRTFVLLFSDTVSLAQQQKVPHRDFYNVRKVPMSRLLPCVTVALGGYSRPSLRLYESEALASVYQGKAQAMSKRRGY